MIEFALYVFAVAGIIGSLSAKSLHWRKRQLDLQDEAYCFIMRRGDGRRHPQ